MKLSSQNNGSKEHAKPIPPSIPQEICGACKETLFVDHPVDVDRALPQLRDCACLRFVQPMKFSHNPRVCCKHVWWKNEVTPPWEDCEKCGASCLRDKGGNIIEYSANIEYGEEKER